MKKQIANVFGTLLFLLSVQAVCGQAPFGLDNGSFEAPIYNNFVVQSLGGVDCNTFSNNCTSSPNCTVPPSPWTWMRSHGTPGIATSSSPSSAGPPFDGSQYLSMWALPESGEGAYTNFTFEANETYLICFALRLHWGTNSAPSSNAAANAEFFVKAANGLFESSSDNACGEALPIPSSSYTLLTDNYNGGNFTIGAWERESIFFTPTQTFTQLWFHPIVRNGENIQPFIDIDDVRIYTCPETATYSVPGQTIPERVGVGEQINVGTSFGSSSSTPVENNPNVESLITAGNRIVFRRHTRISHNNNGSFTARLEDCNLGGFCNTKRKPAITQFKPNNGEKAGFSVFPNPIGTDDNVMLTMNSDFTGEILVEMYDLQGRKFVQERFNKKGREMLRRKLNISSLPAGMYLLTAKFGTQVFTTKVSVLD